MHPEDLKEPKLSLKFLKRPGKEEYSIAKVSLPQWYHARIIIIMSDHGHSYRLLIRMFQMELLHPLVLNVLLVFLIRIEAQNQLMNG